MKTYELCKNIRKRLITKTAEVFSYVNWSDEFATKHIREIPEGILTADGFFKINPLYLTEEQMIELDFGLWSDDNPIRLIPL